MVSCELLPSRVQRLHLTSLTSVLIASVVSMVYRYKLVNDSDTNWSEGSFVCAVYVSRALYYQISTTAWLNCASPSLPAACPPSPPSPITTFPTYTSFPTSVTASSASGRSPPPAALTAPAPTTRCSTAGRVTPKAHILAPVRPTIHRATAIASSATTRMKRRAVASSPGGYEGSHHRLTAVSVLVFDWKPRSDFTWYGSWIIWYELLLTWCCAEFREGHSPQGYLLAHWRRIVEQHLKGSLTTRRFWHIPYAHWPSKESMLQ